VNATNIVNGQHSALNALAERVLKDLKLEGHGSRIYTFYSDVAYRVILQAFVDAYKLIAEEIAKPPVENAWPAKAKCHKCGREVPATKNGILSIHARTVREELDYVNPLACSGSDLQMFVPSRAVCDECKKQEPILMCGLCINCATHPKNPPQAKHFEARRLFELQGRM
jgi:hypothetical protein